MDADVDACGGRGGRSTRMSVVVFEQGPRRTEKDFTNDELQFVQRFY